MKTMLKLFLVAIFLAGAAWAFDDGGGDGGNGGNKGGQETGLIGMVQALPAGGLIGNWMVANVAVQVSAATEIKEEKGPIAVGVCVEVKGQSVGGGSIAASEIESTDAEACGQTQQQGTEADILGPVQSLPSPGLAGDWTVAGRLVHVLASTEIGQENSAPISVGTCVEVQGEALADSSINASRIEVKDSSSCGTPSNKPVEFAGVIEGLPPTGLIGDWQVAQRTVHVTAGTEVQQEHGAAAVGACVQVEGQTTADSSVNATEITVEPAAACGGSSQNPVEFQGAVQSLPASGLVGDWQIDSRTVHVFTTTKVEQEKGPVAVGSCVEVKGQTEADGSVDAVEIDARSSSAGCGTAPGEQETELLGLVQSLPSSGLVGDWQVSGQTVHVLATTRIQQEDGAVGVGSCVSLQGMTQADSSINATEIETQSASKCPGAMGGVTTDFKGTVQALPAAGLAGDWNVGGRTVHVTSATDVSDAAGIATGSCVEVSGQMLADQSVNAQSIELKAATACLAGTGAEAEIMGLVQTLPAGGVLVGDWHVANTTVHVLQGTNIDQEHGAVAIGACVEAKGTLLADRSINAISVEVDSASGTCLSESGVVDAASLLPGSVSPGELVSLFGLRVGPAALTTLQLVNGKVATTLSGVRVLFDGQPAPMLAAASGQLNVVVPFGIAGRSSTQVQVENHGVWSNPVQIPVAAASPGVFTEDGSGRGQAAALNQDGSLNNAGQPADRGSIVVLFATGGGISNQDLEDGQVVTNDSFKPDLPVTVTIGGVNAEVMFAGMAPNMVAGVLQINARVPAGATVGDSVAVQVKIGDFISPAQASVAVH